MKACNVSNTATGRIAKFMALYEGPYKIRKQIARNTYILVNTNTNQERGQFHAMDLKPYRSEREAEEKRERKASERG